MEHDPYARRADDLSRYGFGRGAAYAVLHPYRPARHCVRIPSRSDAYSLRHAPRKFPVERTGDVPPETCGVPHLARDRRLFDAVVQTARGPRVPSCRTVQQPRPGRYTRPELYSGAAGFDHRPALHADLGHGGRRRDVRNGHVVVRPGTSALVLAGLPRHGARRPRPERHARPPQHRQMVLRLLPRLHSRPLRAGLSDLFLRLRPLRRGGLGQGGALRLAQPLCAGHDARRARKILRHQCQQAFPRDVRRAGAALGVAAAGRRQRRAADADARRQLHDLPVAPAARRRVGAGAQDRLRPAVAFGAARHPYGRRGDDLLYRTGFDTSCHGRRPRMVDRVPPFETLRTAGQFAVVLHGSLRRYAPDGRRPPQRALSHAVGGCRRVGRIQSRRPLYGRRTGKRGRGETL